jgi:hypothetical protein
VIPNDEIEKINKGLLTLNVIWAAMLMSLFIYIFVGLYIKNTLRITMEKNVLDILRNVLYSVSFIILITTRFIRKLILSGKGKSTFANTDKSSYQRYQPSALARYTTAMVVSLALTESIGIYGLVLFFLGKNEADLYLFILISAATMLIYRPKRDEIVNLTQELNKQTAKDSLQRMR